MTHFSLQGKTALITGGSNGIGLAVAQRYLAAGAHVVIADISGAETAAATIGAEGVRMDVGDERSVADALAWARGRIGALDIVVNNAGVGDVGPSIADTAQTLLDKLTRINQWGVLYGLKHAPGVMNDGGAIINTASLAGVISLPGQAVYAAGKRAVISMSETAALELGARGIRVNAVCPGYVADTAMGSGDEGQRLCEAFCALGRAATADDLVGLYHFLAADESRYLTGQALRIDGGWSCGITEQLLLRVTGSAGSPR